MPRHLNLYVLLFGMLGCGLISIYLGKDLTWDLANYHYYNPYAFLHARDTMDYWPPSFVQVFLNPLIDLPTYFLINTFPPLLAVFLLGAVHGINIVLLFLIAKLCMTELNIRHYENLLALFLAVFSMYAPTALMGMGSFQNDNLISIFVLSAVFLIGRGLQTFSIKYIFTAALLLGMGAGLKLTAVLYIIGGLLAFMFLSGQRIKLTLIFVVGVGVGVLITSGYWMWLMWDKYHNPLFPFFNNIFHSPYFPAQNWSDTRFLPQGLWETLFFPFYFSWNYARLDIEYGDFRLLCVYVLFICLAISMLLKRTRSAQAMTLPIRWLLLFFLFSFITWQFYFSIPRYIVTLEMLAPLIIFIISHYLIKNARWRIGLLVVIYGVLAWTMFAPTLTRVPWYGKDYFYVRLPAMVQQTPAALVLVAYPAFVVNRDPRPQNYLLPYFPKQWRFAGVPFQFMQSEIPDKLRQIIASYPGPIMFLAPEKYISAMYQFAAEVGLRADGVCEYVSSERQQITNEKVLLCPLHHHASPVITKF